MPNIFNLTEKITQKKALQIYWVNPKHVKSKYTQPVFYPNPKYTRPVFNLPVQTDRSNYTYIKSIIENSVSSASQLERECVMK